MPSNDLQPTGPSTTEIKVAAGGEGSVAVIEGRGKDAETNAWQTPGSAAFDFRSDTSTTPTASMLAALTQTTLLDDVLQEDPTTNDLESYLSSLLSSTPSSGPSPSASRAGLLVLSGTMGNQLALRSHLQSPPHSVLADHRSHVMQHEAGAMSLLSQAFPLPVVPANGTHLTLADVQRAAILDDNVHHAPTRLIVLENTLGGSILPLAELRAICAWARERGVATHLDGARLWDAVAAGVAEGEFGSLEEGLRVCGGATDSVTVCFSKGLGAPVGSLLVGSERFVKKARHIRKMLGGGTRMSGIIAAPALAAVRDTFFGGRLERAHRVAKRLAQAWTSGGGVLMGGVQTNMIWLDVTGSGVEQGALERAARTEGLLGYWTGEVVRVVCHYQIADEAVEKLERLFSTVLLEARKVERQGNGDRELGTGFSYGAR